MGPQTYEQAREEHGKHVWDHTQSVLCTTCGASVFFPAWSEVPDAFYCADCQALNEREPTQ